MADNNTNTSSNSATIILGDADKRILHEIDTQLKEIEAITFYKKVKDKRDEYKERLCQTIEVLGQASATIQRLEGELRDREGLKQKMEAAEEGLKKLQKRVDELESLKVIISPNEVVGSNGESVATGAQPKTTKMLFEMEKMFLESKEDEVKKKVMELFDSMKRKWERTEKPRLVSDAATRSLTQIIEAIRNDGGASGRVGVKTDELLPSSPSNSPTATIAELRAKVVHILGNEVKRSIDSEFERRVEAESQRRAREKLGQLRINEWPIYYNQNILPRVAELKEMIDNNVFNFLRGPWNIPCQICGATHRSVVFYANVMASIVRDGEIELECNGSYVQPVIGLGKLNPLVGAQRFKLTLAELIEMQLRR